MSRVAKAPIKLPQNVTVLVTDGNVCVKGPKGELKHKLHKGVTLKNDDGEKVVRFTPVTNTTDSWAHAGTARAIINNMVKGVSEGFERTLELVGVGYRAQVNNRKLVLSLGFSHPVEHDLPEGITAETPNNTTIVLKGINKELLGETAANIRKHRKPEPYKGKGIKYAGEHIARKEAKKK